jgi:hypothetical protein
MVSGLSVGTLIGIILGAILSYLFGSHLQHRRWILDNKMREWRELIDELHACLERMGFAFLQINVLSQTDDRNDPEAGIRRGYIALRGRLFIAEAIERRQIIDKWAEIVKYVCGARSPRDDSQRGGPTETGFEQKASALEDELMQIARDDLKITSTYIRWRHF